MLYLPHLDIWGSIFDNLPPVDLIHFGQIDKAARIAVTNYSQLNFDIKRVLLPYFSEEDIKSFRLLQLITGAVISGSTAVQFFDRTTYPGSDLDIYVERQYCRDVAWWLMSRGYEYKPSRPDQPKSFVEAFKSWTRNEIFPLFLQDPAGYIGHGVDNIFDFFKSGLERKVQLISARACPIEVILNFHSTCVMNIITHNAAYSLYPYATFHERRSLVCGIPGTAREQARDKYRERGWSMEERISIYEARDKRSDFRIGRRWVGDGRCWKIPLKPPLSPNPRGEEILRNRITSNSWRTGYFPRKNKMVFLHPESPRLRFHYVCADDEVHEVFRSVVEMDAEDDDEVNEQLEIRFGRGV